MNDTTTKEKVKKIIWEEKTFTEPEMNYSNNIGNDPNVIISNIGQNFENLRCNDIGSLSGIYKIINRVNGKYYVGSSQNLRTGYKSRWSKHKCYLRNNRHPNSHLQRAWNKYGESVFDFTIVKITSPNELLDEEQKYLTVAEGEQDKTYNQCFVAGRPNKLCETSKKNQIEKLKLHYSQPEVKKQISDRMRGRHLSEEHKRLISIYQCSEKNVRRGRKISKLEREKKLDQTIYSFMNKITGDAFVGRQYDFYRKYNLRKGNVSRLINQKYGVKSVHGWTLTSQDIPAIQRRF